MERLLINVLPVNLMSGDNCFYVCRSPIVINLHKKKKHEKLIKMYGFFIKIMYIMYYYTYMCIEFYTFIYMYNSNCVQFLSI
jgi:hypothetical protein